MSRAIFYGNPFAGHIVPTLPVVAELVRRGEQVIYYNDPDFEAAISATGAEFRPYPSLPPRPRLGPLTDLSLWGAQAMETILDDRRVIAVETKPDYILYDAAGLWGGCIAELQGVPAIVSSPFFALNLNVVGELFSKMPRNKFRSKNYGGLLRNLWMLFQTNRRLRARYGLSAPYRLARRAQHLVYTSRSLQPRAAEFNDRFWFVGAPGAERQETAPLPEGFDESRPTVLFAMGTFCRATTELVRTCVEALRDINAQVVMALDPDEYREALAHAPDNFIVSGFVPQLQLLERSAVFINHGGVGSASEALLFGVPMVLLPQAFDHFLMAERATQEGAGLMFPDAFTAAELRDSVERVLRDRSFRENAVRLGRSLAKAGGTKRAADLVLQWAAQRTQRSSR